MAKWRSWPKSGTGLAASGIVLLAAWFATPALASSNTGIICNDAADATLEIPTSKLTVDKVSHDIEADDADTAESSSDSDILSPTLYLTPRVEAVLRKVFKDTDTATPIADSDKRPEMNTRVPGVSDDELARYKRQMYRTDI